jgi:hypothetical protein
MEMIFNTGSMGVLILFLLVWMLGVAVSAGGADISRAPQYSIVMTMICRDEEVNFRSNLAAWLPLIDSFVFLMDTRTGDNSTAAIAEILGGRASYMIVPHVFDGFGPARTRSLQLAWQHYSHCTHVWISDPDWKPIGSTMNMDDLDLQHEVFRFLSYDRNGLTTRRMDWLLRHREGLKMRYNLHEVLDIGYYSVKVIEWTIHEIEQKGSWHTTVGHANSFSTNRYLFDLSMLYKDLAEYGHDPHTHYYLGVTHEAYAVGLWTSLGHLNDDVYEHIDRAVKYMELRITAEYKDEFMEERWGTMYLLGSLHSRLKVGSVDP